MIYVRKSKKDDEHMYQLAKQVLYPVSRVLSPTYQFNRKDFDLRLKRGKTYIVKSDEGSILGFVNVFMMKDNVWIDMLALTPQQQRKGWGTILLEKVEKYGKKHKCARISLYVDLVNENAMMFYTRMGFQAIHYDVKLKSFLYSKLLQ